MEILLVEDSAGDAVLIRQFLAEVPVPVNLHIARDGEQALALLESDDFHPTLIILDLNIPRIPGHSLLERWRASDIPVVVFSSSQIASEKARVLALGAREFIEKPTDIAAFGRALQGMVERWGEGSKGAARGA